MRQKSIAFKYFHPKTTDGSEPAGKIQQFVCTFCKKNYALHATRMLEHLTKCYYCPTNLRSKFMKQAKNLRRRKYSNSNGQKIVLPILPMLPDPRDLSSELDNPLNNKISNESLNKMLATAIFVTETPLNIVTNKYWIEFLKHLNPSYQLPSSLKLSTTLLTEVYDDIHKNVRQIVSTAQTVGIQIEAWINDCNENVLNFVITTPDPFYYKTFSTMELIAIEKYTTEKISQVVKEVGIDKVLVLCFNNDKKCYKPCSILSRAYADKPFSYYQCIITTLKLLIDDIVTLNVSEQLLNAAMSIIERITQNSILLENFQKVQKSNEQNISIVSLELPNSLSRKSIIICLESLSKNKVNVKVLSLLEECGKLLGKNIKNNILNDSFWKKIEDLLSLINFIQKWITVFENDNCKTGDVAVAFYEIEKLINSHALEHTLSNDKKIILSALNDRRKKSFKPPHFAANILTPTYKGRHLKSKEMIEGIQYIYNLANHMGYIDESMILQNIADYRADSGFWNLDFVKTSAKNENITPLTFWKGICTDLPLRYVAECILCLPVACRVTRATEKLTNEDQHLLTEENSEKIFYIQHNLRLLNSKISNDTDTEDVIEVIPKEEVHFESDNAETPTTQIESVYLQEVYTDNQMPEDINIFNFVDNTTVNISEDEEEH